MPALKFGTAGWKAVGEPLEITMNRPFETARFDGFPAGASANFLVRACLFTPSPLSRSALRARLATIALTLTLAAGFLACDGGASLRQSADTPTPMVSPRASDAEVPGQGYTAPADLQFTVREALTGLELPESVLWERMAAASVVCLGETHDNFAHHAVQYAFVKHMQAGSAAERAIALEMFETGFQGVVESYGQGMINADQLVVQSEYATRWGFDFALYAPILALGPSAGHPLVAMNPARELTRFVARNGLASLSPEQMAALPDMDLLNTEHRAWFREQISGAHGELDAQGFENFYAAQIIRDETMAATMTARLADANVKHISAISGWGHCMNLAIPQRLRRRGVEAVLSLRMISQFEDVQGAIDSGYYDLLIVLP